MNETDPVAALLEATQNIQSLALSAPVAKRPEYFQELAILCKTLQYEGLPNALRTQARRIFLETLRSNPSTTSSSPPDTRQQAKEMLDRLIGDAKGWEALFGAVCGSSNLIDLVVQNLYILRTTLERPSITGTD